MPGEFGSVAELFATLGLDSSGLTEGLAQSKVKLVDFGNDVSLSAEAIAKAYTEAGGVIVSYSRAAQEALAQLMEQGNDLAGSYELLIAASRQLAAQKEIESDSNRKAATQIAEDLAAQQAAYQRVTEAEASVMQATIQRANEELKANEILSASAKEYMGTWTGLLKERDVVDNEMLAQMVARENAAMKEITNEVIESERVRQQIVRESNAIKLAADTEYVALWTGLLKEQEAASSAAMAKITADVVTSERLRQEAAAQTVAAQETAMQVILAEVVASEKLKQEVQAETAAIAKVEAAATAEANAGSLAFAGSILKSLPTIAAFGAAFSLLKQVEVAANLERSSLALDHLTGSAEKTQAVMENLTQIALSNGLSFPSLVTAEQRFLDFGVDIEKVPSLLQAVADAAAATNKPFDSVANSFERLILSGQAERRQLSTIGVNVHELAEELGILDTQVATVFKGFNQSERTTALELVMGRLKGTAQDAAKGIAGQWENVKTQLALYFSDIVKNANPVITTFETLIADYVEWARTGTIQSIDNPNFKFTGNNNEFVATPVDTTAKDQARRDAQRVLWESMAQDRLKAQQIEIKAATQQEVALLKIEQDGAKELERTHQIDAAANEAILDAYNQEILQVTIAGIEQRRALIDSNDKTFASKNAELDAERLKAESAYATASEKLAEGVSTAKQKLLDADLAAFIKYEHEEQRQKEQVAEHVMALNVRMVADRAKALGEEEAGEAAHATRMLELQKAQYDADYQAGLITGRQRVQLDLDIDAQEEQIQRDSIAKQIEALDQRGKAETDYASKRQTLLNQQSALEDKIAADEQKRANAGNGLTAEFHDLSIKTQTELNNLAARAMQDFDDIDSSGEVSAHNLQAAWLKMYEAQLSAGREFSLGVQLLAASIEQEVTSGANKVYKMAQDISREISRLADKMAQDFVNAIAGLFDNSANDAIDKQLATLNDQLTATTQAWQKAQTDIAAAMVAINAKADEALTKAALDNANALAKESADYQAYVQDIQAKLRDLVSSHREAQQQIRDDAAKSLRDQTTSYQRFVEDTNIAIQRALAKGDTQQVADLQLALKRRTEDYQTFVRDQQDTTAKALAKDQEAQQKETESLNKQLADRKAADDKFLADQAAKFADQVATIEAQRQKDLADEQASLAEKQAAYDAYVADYKLKLADLESQHKSTFSRITAAFVGMLTGFATEIGKFIASTVLKGYLRDLQKMITDAFGLPSLTAKLVPSIYGPGATNVPLPGATGRPTGEAPPALSPADSGAAALLATVPAMSAMAAATVENSFTIKALIASNEQLIASGLVVKAQMEAVTSALVLDFGAETADTVAEVANTVALLPNTAAELTEVVTSTLLTGAVVGDVAATAADTVAEVANTTAEVADTTAEVADTAAEVANTAALVADTAAQGATAAAGAASGLGGLLGGISDLASGGLLGAGIAAAAGITQGIQMSRLINLTGEIEISTRQAKEILLHMQETSFNTYLPYLVHIDNVWAAILTGNDHLADIHGEEQRISGILLDILAAIGSGGGGGGGTGTGTGGGGGGSDSGGGSGDSSQASVFNSTPPIDTAFNDLVAQPTPDATPKAPVIGGASSLPPIAGPNNGINFGGFLSLTQQSMADYVGPVVPGVAAGQSHGPVLNGWIDKSMHIIPDAQHTSHLDGFGATAYISEGYAAYLQNLGAGARDWDNIRSFLMYLASVQKAQATSDQQAAAFKQQQTQTASSVGTLAFQPSGGVGGLANTGYSSATPTWNPATVQSSQAVPVTMIVPSPDGDVVARNFMSNLQLRGVQLV